MINTFPHISCIFNRRKVSSPTKKASVEIRITHNYKQKYISTGIMLLPSQWRHNRVVNTPDALQLNQLIDKLLIEIRQIIVNMSSEGNLDINLIPIKLQERRLNNITFLEFCEQRSIIRKYGRTKDSQERYNRFIRLFKAWGKIVYFKDINDKNIIDYDRYLANKGMKTYSKWNNYHRFLNSFILDAIEEKLLNKNPYKYVNIDKGKQVKGINKYLSPIEFKKIKEAPLPTITLEKVRDLFIFQTYTCLSYIDLKNFNYKNIYKYKEIYLYKGYRHKTNKEFIIPIYNNIIYILYKYNNELPIISNVKYNFYLKIVAQSAGIDKPISSHWARHTGATLLLNKGIDIRIISKICGHSSIKITEQVYAKLLDDTIIEAIKNIDL